MPVLYDEHIGSRVSIYFTLLSCFSAPFGQSQESLRVACQLAEAPVGLRKCLVQQRWLVFFLTNSVKI